MAACERCEKNGDLACVALLRDNGESFLALTLHKNGTVDLPDPSEVTLLKLLAFLGETWLRTSYLLASVLTNGVALAGRGELSAKQVADATDAGFRKLRLYGTMDGAVRERMRADGHAPDEGSRGEPFRVTQKAGRA